MKSKLILILIIILAFFLRAINPSFPFFTSDEARIAYRGYTLSHFGEDEMGRKWPMIFNSSYDYQLPLVSYLTALGGIIPGSYEVTSRLPFILIGSILVFISYLVSKRITGSEALSLINAFLISSSPTLIFLSKFPNEAIVLSFLLTIFFLVLTLKNCRKKLFFILITTLLMLFTSKTAWFIIPAFSYAIFNFTKEWGQKSKQILLVLTVICLLAFILFALIPQGTRSLKENNFTLFSDITVSNGINYLRGEGLKANQSPLLEKMLFNKSHFLTTGFLHWLLYFQPNLQFTNFDSTGESSYIGTGVWTAILVIPFLIGLIYLLKEKVHYKKLLFVTIFIFTFQGFFISPKISNILIILCLPFIGIIISVGLLNIRRAFRIFLIGCAFISIITLNLDLSTQRLEAAKGRPGWIKPVILESRLYTERGEVLVSDDILGHAEPFFQLFGRYEFKKPDVKYPYLLTVNQSQNLKFLLSESKLEFCKESQSNTLIVTKRDFDKISSYKKVNNFKEPKILKIFTDDFAKEKAYLLKEDICIK